jgi:eukaryotic-like serine/threonine-protein kinase
MPPSLIYDWLGSGKVRVRLGTSASLVTAVSTVIRSAVSAGPFRAAAHSSPRSAPFLLAMRRAASYLRAMDATSQLNTALAGRYTIVREIGAGGMATVYLALDLRHDRRVALKLLNPELGAVLGVERFLSEIKVTANLQHPNLLPLFDSGQISDQPERSDGSALLFYTMPYVEGESLRARLEREKQLPVDEAIRITTAIASALDYAHRRDVIHRDLKPENILLQDGQPMLADFGIALAVSKAGGNRVTQTGLSLGTPQYMSPEQATGDRTIDGRSDQYSLAAVLYEMLAGDPPYAGSTAQAIMARLLTERPRDVRVMRDLVPEPVAQAIDRALAKLPADRFQTVAAFADALQARAAAGRAPAPAFGGGSPIQRSRDTAPPRAWASGFARRLASPAPWIGISVLALGVAAWALFSRQRVAVPPTVRYGIQGPVFEAAAPGAIFAASPDGRTVVYDRVTSTATVPGLWARRVDELTDRHLEGAEGAEQPFFSPDGQWVGFIARGQLRKVPLAGGPVVTLADIRGPMFGASWIPGRDSIVVAVGSGLGVVPASGGQIRSLTKRDSTAGEIQAWPHVLADGKTALFGSWRGGRAEQWRIAKVDLATGRTRVFENLIGTAPLDVLDGWLVFAGANGVLTAVPFNEKRAQPAGNPVPLAEHTRTSAFGGTRASLSPAGLLMYQTGAPASQMMAVDMHGSMRPLSPEVRSFGMPRFSPDGKSIAVQIQGQAMNDIWLYSIASGTTTRITTEGGVNDRPEWTPDGKSILFRSDRNGSLAIWTQPADRSAPPTVLFGEHDAWILEALLTPDSKAVVFRTGTLGAADIWYRRLDRGSGEARNPVAVTPFLEWAPRLSPDGRWIAYSSDESGMRQVYVQPFPGPGARVPVSVDGGDYPIWSHDQHYLFFRNAQKMMRAKISTAGRFTVESPELLFESEFDLTPGHANYDVSPDGQHLLMLKPAGGDAQTIIAYDWQSALKAQVTRRGGR